MHLLTINFLCHLPSDNYSALPLSPFHSISASSFVLSFLSNHPANSVQNKLLKAKFKAPFILK